MANIWDKKANNYRRFEGKAGEFEARVIEVLHRWGVDFRGARVIDIGCGTGVWTLLLARKAAWITGVDSSGGMLEILREDAAKFEIKNVDTITSGWDQFIGSHELNLQALNFSPQAADKNLKFSPKIYDIALTTMSPAISTESDFERFNALAKTKIYLGWREPRTSDLLEPFFAKFGRRTGDFMVADRLEAWLKARKIAFFCQNLCETRVAKRSFEEAVQNICWHLEINGLRHHENEVREMLRELGHSEVVEETIGSLMGLFVF